MPPANSRHRFVGIVAALALIFASNSGRLDAQVTTFDHRGFDALLRAHVVGGLVDYDAFAASADFGRYLARLSAFDPSSLGRDEQLAFWINAYNAYTIRLVNAHHERKSIRNINRTFGFVKAYGPWREKIAAVGGRTYGLDEIEQDIVRKRFAEPRTHFALVCAALGCPPLRSEAYVGSRIDEQLDDQGRTFVAHSPQKNRVDVATRTAYLSPIFVELRDYIQDFGGTEAAVGRFIARYLPAGPERELLARGNFTVKTTLYDWTLNSTATAKGVPPSRVRP